MQYSNLVPCDIEAYETYFRKNRMCLSSDAFGYKNDDVMLVFNAESVYIIHFENNRIERHRFNSELAKRSTAHQFGDSVTLLEGNKEYEKVLLPEVYFQNEENKVEGFVISMYEKGEIKVND